MIWLSAADKELLAELEREISIDNLQAHWEHLMTFTPMPSGSPQETQVILFLQAKLEEYGVSNQLLWYEGYLSNPKEVQLTVLTPKEFPIPCTSFRQVASTPPEGIQDELIYISPEELGKVDGKDKIVLSERVFFREIQQFWKMGVKGLVVISIDTAAPDVIHQRADFSVSGNPTADNYSVIPQIPMVEVSHTDGQRLKQFCSQCEVRVHLRSIMDTGWKQLPLLIAEIRGTKNPEKFILVNGHVDTPPFSPGVTDNVSGDVLMLELARIFNKYKNRLNRSIRIAFWTGHEIGRYAGSTWYNDTFWHDLRYNCITGVNIDSPGAEEATTYGPLYMSETYELQRKCLREVAGVDVERTLWPARDGDSSFWGTGLSNVGLFSERPEDMANPFVNYSGLGWWWHTPWATLDRGDSNILARDAKVNVNFIFHLCNCPILPMDFIHYVDEIQRILEDLQEKSDKIRTYFNLNPVLVRVKEFKKQVEALEDLIREKMALFEAKNNRTFFEPIFKELNNCIMWVSRHINIVAHSNASKTEQMSMEDFGMKPFPRLQPILELAQMPLPQHPDFKFLVTKLVRQRNFIEDGFYLAIEQVRDTLKKVKAVLP